MIKRDATLNEISESIAELWEPLNEEQRALLTKEFTIQKFKKNETIYCEGERPTHIMCLLSGKVKIYKDGVGGRTQIIRVIKPVEYFAYRAYFAKEDYVTSGAAIEPTQVCFLPMPLVEEHIRRNNDLAFFFIRDLANNLGQSDTRTVNLTQKHIRGRLAESLMVLYDNYGYEPDSTTLNIYLSREDLANLSNMTTSNAIRTLTAFASEHLITVDGRKIKILNELRRISKYG